MSSSAQLSEPFRLLLPVMSGGLVLVGLLLKRRRSKRRRLLAVFIREAGRCFENLRWLDATPTIIRSLHDLPRGTTVELECDGRYLRVEVPGNIQTPGQDADVVPLDRVRRASGDDAEDGPAP